MQIASVLNCWTAARNSACNSQTRQNHEKLMCLYMHQKISYKNIEKIQPVLYDSRLTEMNNLVLKLSFGKLFAF